MKTASQAPLEAAPIVQLLEPLAAPAPPGPGGDADGDGELAQLERARAFAEPLLAGQLLDTGEPALAHAQGVAAILQAIGAAITIEPNHLGFRALECQARILVQNIEQARNRHDVD